MKRFIPLLLIFVLSSMTWAQDESKEHKNQNPESDTIYKIQVRVIHAGTTGIFGNVPQELSDMRRLLTKAFKYPSYQLSNSIRLSVFGDEDAVALVYPEHYLRITPKGGAKNGEGLKLKAELFHVSEAVDSKSKLFLGNVPQLQNRNQPRSKQNEESQPTSPFMGVEEKKKGREKPLFPIVSSAVLITSESWEAFGGVPVRVDAQSQVSSNRLSTSPTSVVTGGKPAGIQKYLILGMQLEDL